METRTAFVIAGTSIALGTIFAISHFDFDEGNTLKEGVNKRTQALNEATAILKGEKIETNTAPAP